MEAVFKITSSEFDKELFDKIKKLLEDKNAFVTIAVHESSSTDYWEKLRNSTLDIESGRGITFSMDQLETFIKK
ncbi:MAG: hypothetical protein JST43_00765 [Bacteroidetes bacterium]|nr:hypothetical protein [Bacteroidota bacterium]MBS1540711.1 hypothetical protein [Bacteroidota bacterium]